MFDKEKPRKSVFKKTILYGIPALVGAILVSFVAAFFWYSSSTNAVNPNSAVEVDFLVSPGEPALIIADRLEAEGLIKSSTAFNVYLRINGKRGSLQAGQYQLSASQNVEELVAELSNGLVESRNVTIPSGKRLGQIRRDLIADGFSEASVDTALDSQTHANHPISQFKPVDASLEGYVYPETFQVTKNTTATDLIRRSLDETFRKITPELVTQLDAQGLSVHDAVILSSIVEKEVSNLDDKPVVAQIFLKRLREGIMLGSDVTYIYAAQVFGGRAAPDLDNPYNTRIYTGLPPGPVSNFEITSLEAVANPSDTDFLFFVSGDDGTTHYTRTFAEHNAAIEKYCQFNCLLPDQRDDIRDL